MTTKPWRCILCTAVAALTGRSTVDKALCQWCFDDLVARGLKRCCTCNVPKPADAFAPQSKRCRACVKAINVRYNATVRKERDRAADNARQRVRWAANPEKYRALSRASYARTQERRRDYARRYYEANQERVRERVRRYYHAHPGLARSWTRNRKLKAIRAMRGQV